MSTSDATMVGPTPMTRALGGGLLASEIRLIMRRRRNIVMLIGLGLVPVIIGIVLRVANPSSGGGGDGPPSILTQATSNGLFLGFAGLIIVTTFLWPLVMSVVTGESIAGEASLGTLRYLFALPVSRSLVLGVKFLATLMFGLVCAAVVILAGMIAGAVLFPVRATSLSGTALTGGDTVLRALAMAGFGTILMAGVVAIGLFISTLTEVPLAAMAGTAAAPIVSNILGAIPQLEAIHPWLLTDSWLAYGELLRDPIQWDPVVSGVVTQLAYIAVFGSLAWARLTTRDITS